MKASKKILGIVLSSALMMLFGNTAFAQEYDDMYFNSSDRQKQEAKKKAYRDSVRKAEEALISKNVNPDYMDRLQEYGGEELADNEGYYDENYTEDVLNSDRPVNIYNNYYGGQYGYSYADLDAIYWSNPGLYRYTIYDPFYRNRIRSWNRWGYYNPYSWYYNPYDYWYGGVSISYGWSWGGWYRPWYSNWGYYSYDPFCYSPWGYSNYAYGYRGWGRNWGYPGTTVVVVNNYDNDNGIRRGRRVSRSSSYGRVASNNGTSTNNNIGRRPSGGRIDKDTPIQTRRSSSYNEGINSRTNGRVADNSVRTRQSTRGTYEDRNMSTYTQRSSTRDLSQYRNTSRSSSYNNSVRSRNTSDITNRGDVNVNRSRTYVNRDVNTDRTRTNSPSSFRDVRSRTNYGALNNRSTSSTSTNRSYHRSIPSRSTSSSNFSGYNRSSTSRSSTLSSGYRRSSGSSSSGYRSYTPSRSSSMSRGSSSFGRSSSSSSMSRGSSSSSRSSGVSSRSSGSSSRSSSSSSRRGGN